MTLKPVPHSSKPTVPQFSDTEPSDETMMKAYLREMKSDETNIDKTTAKAVKNDTTTPKEIVSSDYKQELSSSDEVKPDKCCPQCSDNILDNVIQCNR